MTTKNKRQALILKIIQSMNVETQSELVDLVKKAGVACTQASISRDIGYLGLVKKGGHYVVPHDPDMPMELDELAQTISAFLTGAEPAGPNLVVIKTITGTAHSVGVYLDRCGWNGLIGTVAGDDTLFAAVENKKAGQLITRRLRRLIP